MSEQPSRPATRRPRPVAELALEGLFASAGELARGWAAALILQSPVESLGALGLEELADEGPALVAGVLGALRSDGELDALLAPARSGDSPARRISAMAGAEGPGGVVDAVEALRGVLTDALMDEFGVPSDPVRALQRSDLADRLAHVCAALLPGALEAQAAAREPSPAVHEPPAGAPITASGAGLRPVGEPPRPVRAGIVIVDERASGESPPAPAHAEARDDRLIVGEPSGGGEIHIRDERGDEGPSAWIRSIGAQLERYERDRAPFAVLLVEFRSETGETPELWWAPIEQLLAEEPGHGTTMTRERAGRYWLLVPGADRVGAASVASRLMRALESITRGRRPAVGVAVGTAVCPEDGVRAPALAAHADVGLYAARAERNPWAPLEGNPGA